VRTVWFSSVTGYLITIYHSKLITPQHSLLECQAVDAYELADGERLEEIVATGREGAFLQAALLTKDYRYESEAACKGMTARPAATWMLRCWTLFAASSASISTTPNIFFQRRFGLLSAQRAYAKAPYKTD
jgi:hypothetical protein